jgi:gliding motility-associated-like protein
VEVIITPQVALFIPNAFTPNGDTHNELYKPYGETPNEYNFWIYDRWGQEIFHTTDIGTGWDGYFKGDESPNDSYIYLIILKDVLGEEHEMKGAFSLVR